MKTKITVFRVRHHDFPNDISLQEEIDNLKLSSDNRLLFNITLSATFSLDIKYSNDLDYYKQITEILSTFSNAEYEIEVIE